MKTLEGLVTIEVRDAETLELKRTIDATNAISLQMFYNDMAPTGNYVSWKSTFHTTQSNSPHRIAVSGRVIKSGNKSFGSFGPGHNNYPATSFWPATNYAIRVFDSEVVGWTGNYVASPPYLQRTDRFNSPATVQTINSIYLYNGNPSNADGIATSIGLNTPCLQNPGEVLDITYRIQFYDSSSINAVDAYVSPTLFRNGYITTRVTTSNNHPAPDHMHGGFIKLPDTSPYNEFRRVIVEADNVSFKDAGGQQNPILSFDHYKTIFDSVFDKADYNGDIISTALIGSTYHNAYLNYYTTQYAPTKEMMLPLLPDGFAFKPIQPIQNHNKDAIEWGLDVDFLASSQGSITVNGDSWTNPDWPEYWRVEFTKTGAVGTANYFFRNRRFLGFESASSMNTTKRMRIADMISDPYDTVSQRTTHDRAHGAGSLESNIEYGADSYVAWDKTGINVHVINKPLVIAYDATTIPAMNATNIRDVAIDGNDNIWVACKNTGLYKITTPLNPATATISLMTITNNGIFSDGECFGVAQGSNGSIWAVINGALIHTTNPNVAIPSFTNYNPTTPTVFDWTEVTNDWTNVKYMRADRNTPTDELAVMYRTASDEEKIVWWSLDGIAYEGPTSSTNFGLDVTYPHQDGWTVGAVDVSQRGNLWARRGPSFASDQIQRLDWGTTNAVDRTAATSPGFAAPIFLYDYYDNPHLGNANISNHPPESYYNTYGGIAISNIDDRVFAPVENDNLHSTQNDTSGWPTGMNWQNRRASSMMVHSSVGSNYYREAWRDGSKPFWLLQYTPDPDWYIDPLNGQHSPYEEVCWDKYHWNGSSWELNYYAPAIDTSSGTNYPAARHNFDTESHRFTGRSMIDASAAFGASVFGSSATATFAFNIQPHQKFDEDSSNSQTTPNVNSSRKTVRETALIDISDKTRRCKLMWKGYDTTPQMAFYVDGEAVVYLTPTPADLSSGFYRVVVVVNGTSIDVYVNGAQVGSTITAPAVFDWTNTSTDVKAFLGCRVHTHSHLQRHSTYESEFFQGYMENVQFWNVAWDATDISNDFANINGVIASKPPANLIARYELTQSLEGLETKPTHLAAELMDEGLTIAFNEGASGDSFVATDYYTFGVVDGVLKDNSMSFTRSMSVYHKPVDHNFTVFTNESGTAVIEGAATAQVTEPAVFHGNDQLNNNQFGYNEAASLQVIDQYPGKLHCASTNPGFIEDFAYNQNMRGGYVHQPIVNDGYFEAAITAADTHLIITVATTPVDTMRDSSQGNYQNDNPYSIVIRPTGNVDIYEFGALVLQNATTYTLDSVFRIRKIATVVTYYIVNNNVETLLYTSSIAATGTLYCVVASCLGGNGVVDAVINYTRIDNMMRVGDELALSGAYDSKFLRVDTEDSTSYELFIDANPAIVISEHNATYGEIVTFPAPGEVYINGKMGWLIFNDADIGKTLTGRVTVIYDEL